MSKFDLNLFRACIAMIKVDERIHPKELAWLDRNYSHIDGVSNALKEHITIDSILEELTSNQIKKFMKLAKMVALADDHYAPEEREAYNKVYQKVQGVITKDFKEISLEDVEDLEIINGPKKLDDETSPTLIKGIYSLFEKE